MNFYGIPHTPSTLFRLQVSLNTKQVSPDPPERGSKADSELRNCKDLFMTHRLHPSICNTLPLSKLPTTLHRCRLKWLTRTYRLNPLLVPRTLLLCP